MRYQFPEDFLWGSSVWATGTEQACFEAGKAATVWDEHYRIDPKRFYKEMGPDQTCDSYHRYEEFSQLADEIGHNSYRTSILWARLLPDGKTVNPAALDFYRSMFKAFKEKGMFLSVVLYWFDMPLFYENKGGFSNREIIDDFVFYCQKCFELFDGLVDGWFIYNEPVMDVFFKYQMRVCWPCECDVHKAMKAIYNMNIAHAEVVKAFKNGQYHGKIGSVLNQSIVYPRSSETKDLKAKRMYELFSYDAFEQPLLKGEFHPEWLNFAKEHGISLPFEEGDTELIKEYRISFLGINTYLPIRVQHRENQEGMELRIDFAKSSFYEPYIWPERKFNKDRGWEIYPKVIYDVLMRNKKEFPNVQMLITENGIGIQNESRFRNEQGMICDSYRIEFIRDHLVWVHKALCEGCNVLGYHVWSFIDLWSPTNQFKNCYGLYEYDLQTHEIKKKLSAQWYKKVTLEKGFDDLEVW